MMSTSRAAAGEFRVVNDAAATGRRAGVTRLRESSEMSRSRKSPSPLAAPSRAALLLLALAACDEAEGVNVQPLPGLERPSPEARAGLPEVAGTWRFAGWELPVRDTATAGEGMVPPGALVVSTQRLDSVAGDYVREGQRFPFVGEVRRDGILAVVAFGPDGQGSYVAGRVRRDTLWIELTSLSAAQTWSAGSRAALVRTPVAEPFVRYQGGFVPLNVDSIRADSVRMDSLRLADSLRMRLADSLRAADSARAAAQTPAPGQPQPEAQPPAARPAPPAGETQPPAAVPPATGAPKAAPKQPPAKEQPRRTPEPERRPPRPRDTVRIGEPEREREAEREREREREPEPEVTPVRPDTTRPRPVIIP